jgi:hypothetical protein
MIDCCAFSYFSLFLPTRKKQNTQNLKLIRNRFKELTDGPHCIDPGSFRIDRDPMFRSSPRILPPFVAILASTWRYIVEKSTKNQTLKPKQLKTSKFCAHRAFSTGACNGLVERCCTSRLIGCLS